MEEGLGAAKQPVKVEPFASLDDDEDITLIHTEGLDDFPIDSTMVVDATVLVGASDDDFWLSPLPHASSDATDATVVSATDHSLARTAYSSSSLSLATMVHTSPRCNDDPPFNPVRASQMPAANWDAARQHAPDSVVSLFRDTFTDNVPYPTPLSPLYPMFGMEAEFHRINSPLLPPMPAPSAVSSGAVTIQGYRITPWLIHPSPMIPVVSMQAQGRLTDSANGATLTAQSMMPSNDLPITAITSNFLIPPVVTDRTKANDSTTCSTGDGVDVANRKGRKPDRASSKEPSTKRKAECDLHPPPVRALTAYNFFFRFERDRLLKFCSESGKGKSLDALLDGEMPPEYFEHYSLTPENSADFQEELLRDQWSRDHTVKRKHCKSHGKISFRSLSKRIAQGWKALPQSVKDVFRDIATKDFDRYTRDVAERG